MLDEAVWQIDVNILCYRVPEYVRILLCGFHPEDRETGF